MGSVISTFYVVVKSLASYINICSDTHMGYQGRHSNYVVIESETVKTKLETHRHVICCSYAIVTHRYKYIWNPLTGEELYDILKDPRET